MTETYNRVTGRFIIEDPEKGLLANLFNMNSGIGDIKKMVLTASKGDVKMRYRKTGASKLSEIGAGLRAKYTLVTLFGKGTFDEITFKSLLNKNGYWIKDSSMGEYN